MVLSLRPAFRHVSSMNADMSGAWLCAVRSHSGINAIRALSAGEQKPRLQALQGGHLVHDGDQGLLHDLQQLLLREGTLQRVQRQCQHLASLACGKAAAGNSHMCCRPAHLLRLPMLLRARPDCKTSVATQRQYDLCCGMSSFA